MSFPVYALFSKCSCHDGVICLFCLRLSFAAIVMLAGAVMAWIPRKIIDWQTALYRPFNWKLEPISMEKEIRNTRIMGLTILVLGCLSFVYILFS